MISMGILWVEAKVTRLSNMLLALILIPLMALFLIDVLTYVFGKVFKCAEEIAEVRDTQGGIKKGMLNIYNENINIKRINWYSRTNISFSDKGRVFDNFLRVNKDD